MRKRKLIARIVFGVIVAFLLIFLFGGVLQGCNSGSKDAPKVSEAPWIIQTSSRFYYAEKLRLEPDGTPTIEGYWTYDGKRFKYVDKALRFDPVSYGDVDVITR